MVYDGNAHFSHPFLGTYEVVQFLELGNLKGTHPGVVYELHTNPMVAWDANPIPLWKCIMDHS